MQKRSARKTLVIPLSAALAGIAIALANPAVIP